jgi:hypothetical protein
VNNAINALSFLFFLLLSSCDIPPEWVRTSQSEETRRICDVYNEFETCFRRNFPVGSDITVAQKFLIDAGFEYQGIRSDTKHKDYVRDAHDLSPLKIRIQISEKNKKINDIHLVQG